LLLTKSDPSGLGEREYGLPRQIIRAAVLLALVVRIAVFSIQSINHFPSLEGSMFLLNELGVVANLLGTVVMLNYLSKLALRIPDIDASRRAKYLMWGFGSVEGMAVLNNTLLALLGRKGFEQVAGIDSFACLRATSGLLMLILGVIYLVVLVGLGMAFNKQAEFARQNWGLVNNP
jgi:hypothetical protein